MMSSVEIARLSTGVSLPYVEAGGQSGVPLLLIHAWGESRGSFSRLLPLLPRTVHAFAMDQRGHGDADKPADGYAMADFVADLVAFQDSLGLGPCILVGSSSGGYVAQRFAVDEPSRTLGLVLVGAPRSLHGRPPFADEVERLTDPIDREWVRSSLDWFEFHEPVPAEYLADRIEDGVRMPAHVWKLALAGLSEAAVPTETGTIQAPTLVIWGDRDDLLPHGEGAKLAAAIPRSRLVAYEATGHLVLWEQPERVANDIANFVDELILNGRGGRDAGRVGLDRRRSAGQHDHRGGPARFFKLAAARVGARARGKSQSDPDTLKDLMYERDAWETLRPRSWGQSGRRSSTKTGITRLVLPG